MTSSYTSSTHQLVSPITSRKIRLSPALINPSGKWYAGTKAAFDFYPDPLIKRLKLSRRKAFDVEHTRLVADAQRELQLLTKQPPPAGAKPGAGDKKDPAAAESGSGKEEAKESSPAASAPADEKAPAADDKPSSPPPSDPLGPTALRKAELKARVALLDDLRSSYSDPGPLLECVVYHDGQHWRALVGGAEGELAEPSAGLPSARLEPKLDSDRAVLDLSHVEKGMTDFRIEREWQFFGPLDRLSYSVNILTDEPAPHPSSSSSDAGEGDAGKKKEFKPVTLSIVAVSGSHGTHVAGIVGASFAPQSKDASGLTDEDAARNGVAPGCEIVSLKIGDSRVGTMEQGQALLRAARALIDTKCDIANLSYGEDGAFGAENRGAFAKALREVVIRERDILFVSSAGNNGPALTTVGWPGGTTSSVLSVGAYLTAGDMQKAEYALIESPPDNPTTWSSRGPTADGDRGVGIYAPGAAITSIPQYCLQQTQFMQGTSMAGPSACGKVALLVSAMKANGIPVTPARVLKAVRDTGKDVNDDLDVPFFQVDKAWDHLVEHKDHAAQDAEFRVSITPPGKPVGRVNTDKRGIYLRERFECDRLSQFQATVRPTFKALETERTWALQLRCSLVATQSWIKVAPYVLIGSQGRTFEVRVDPSSLPPGLHSGWIQGYDSEKPGHKLFEIPVTVTKPEVLDAPVARYENQRLSAAQVTRRFISVPEGATWATMRVVSKNHAAQGTNARLWMHLVQLEPMQRLHSVEKAWLLSLAEDDPTTRRFAVKGGLTMEVATAQYFHFSSAFEFDLVIEFHGIQISPVTSGRDEVTLIGGEGVAKLECISSLRAEEFKPSISFDTRRTFLRPSQSDIVALSTPRDLQVTGKPIFELITTYNLKLTDAANKISCRLPLSGNLYDSAVPILVQIFDANKKVHQFFDVYPKEVTLPRGEYTIKAEFLHEDISALQKLKNATLTVDQKLSKPGDVKLEMYENHVDLFGGKPASGDVSKAGVKLMPGERKVLFLDTNLEGDKVPKEAQPGDVLVGTLSFAEAKNQLRYIVPPAAKKEKDDDGAAKNDETTIDLLVGVAKKIKDEKEKLAFIEKLIVENPKHLGLLRAKLEAVGSAKDADKAESASTILAAVDAVLKEIDQEALRLFLGTKQLPTVEQSDEEKKRAREFEKQKSAVTFALNRKCRAILARDFASGGAEQKMLTGDGAFEEAFKQYRQYYSPESADKEFSNVYVRWAIRHGRYGLALQSLRKSLKELGSGGADNLEELQRARNLERELLGPVASTGSPGRASRPSGACSTTRATMRRSDEIVAYFLLSNMSFCLARR